MIVVNFFYSEWASAREINRDIGQKTKTELDANLRLFYAEARNKDGVLLCVGVFNEVQLDTTPCLHVKTFLLLLGHVT